MKIFLLLLPMALYVKAADPVNLQVFQYAYYQGDQLTFKIQDCTQIPRYVGSKVGSARLVRGTCVKMYRSSNCQSKDCDGSVCHLAYPRLQIPTLNESIYHNLNSAQPCTVYSKTVQCPNGTWVRRMDFGDDDLRSGITIYCYKPGDRSPTVDYNTRGQPLTSYSSQYCYAAGRGVRVLRNSTYQFIPKAEGLCKYSDNIDADSIQCDKTDAMVGITVEYEELSYVIKSITPVCRTVEDPVATCTPSDAYSPVVVCDNTQGFTDTSCQYTKTVGYGVSSTLTVEQSLELNFYAEFGFDVKVGEILSGTFKGKLGLSVTTGFDWSKSSTSTWNEAVSVQVGVKTPPNVITRLEQVVGQCSYYEVRVNFFRRVDKYGNGTASTLLVDEDEEFIF